MLQPQSRLSKWRTLLVRSCGVRACSLVNAESDVYIEAKVRHEENLE